MYEAAGLQGVHGKAPVTRRTKSAFSLTFRFCSQAEEKFCTLAKIAGLETNLNT